MIDLTKIIPKKFDGSDIGQRENLKIEGSKEYKNSTNINDKVNGIIKIIYSHYCRSFETSKTKHPKFEDYAKHWLWAEIGSIINDVKIRNILLKKFPSLKQNLI